MRHGRLVALGTAIALLSVVAMFSSQSASAQQASACLAGGAVTDANNTGLVSDCEALLEARGSLVGTGATRSLNWMADIPISDWYGVLMSGTPRRVTALRLRGRNEDPEEGIAEAKLKGSIPPELGRLSMLRDVNLRTNELSGSIPAELGDLTNLVRLNLHTNMLSGPIPDLSDLTGLEELYLANNAEYNPDGSKVQGSGLAGTIPAWLNGMTEMRELWLWGNSLTGTIPDLSGMTSLDKLKLASNNLEGGVPDGSKLPPNMTWLIIDRNPLGGTIPNLSSLSRLRLLWLHSNGLTGSIPAGDMFPASLDDLNLRDNMLTGTIPDLSDLDNLTRLRLHNNSLSGEVPATLGGLDSLKNLWLHGNMLAGPIPAALGRLTKLQRLWLSDNMLSGEIPVELGDLSGHSLVQWRLAGNALTGCVPEGLEDVQDSDLDSLDLPVCGEEPVVIDPTPVTATIAPGEAAVVTHDSGAEIEIPAGATMQAATVSITEVTPPESVLSLGRTFDFAVTNASGEDVELQGPVTLRLPYSLSEGKNEADVAVLRWNEDVRRWEAVFGGVVDGATRTVTVESSRLSAKGTDTGEASGVNELGVMSTGKYNTPMEHFARSMLSLVTGQAALRELTKGLSRQYDAGFKHLVSFHVKEGFRPPFFPVFKLGEVGLSLVFDINDLLSLPAILELLNVGIVDEEDKAGPVTGEGNAHYVTFWLNANAALKAEASAEFPVGITFSMPYTNRHRATPDHNRDPKFDASFSAMTMSYPVGQVSFLNINSNGNVHPVEAQLGACVTCELKLKAGVSFADVSFNVWKGELNTNVLNEALAQFLKPDRDTCSEEEGDNTLPDKTDPGGQVSQEFAASELMCSIFQGGLEAVRVLLEDSVEGFTSTEEMSPKAIANLDPANYNKITAVAGGHDVNGDGREDMVFPSRDEDGTQLSDLPLTVVTTADRFEDRDYFVKLLNQDFLESFGWTIRTKDENDDGADFKGDALSINATEWLVTNTDDAAVELTARFALVHDKFIDDELHEYRVVLMKDRVLSDLSIEATGKPTTVLTGDTLTYEVEITNNGHHPAEDIKLHLANMLAEGFALKDAATTDSSLDCQHENFVGLTCDLPDLDDDESVVVTLEFEPVQCLPRVLACFPPGYDDVRTVFSVESDTEDPALGNNSAEVRTSVRHATDRDALVALYNATDGDNWRDNTNWLSNEPLGQWHGVTTNSDGRVTKVVLPRNDLAGELPDDLGILRRLTHLVLWDNDLSGEIPEALGDLSDLECLSLWSNDLSGEIPGVLGDLTNLTQLDLLGNDLDGSIPAVLGDLTNLRRLHLAENDFSGSIPSSLGNLTSLESLYLFRNDLTSQIPSSLTSLTNLDWLYMSENDFTGCIPAGLRNVPNHDLGNLSSLSYCSQASTSGVVAQDSSASPQQSSDLDVGPRQSADYAADAEDISVSLSTIYAGQSASIRAQFQNLSPSTGPHGGAATFDLRISVEPPSGTKAPVKEWDNQEFTLNQERTFSGLYTFASAGTYTVYAEVYDNMGQQSGWNADNRFDQLIETFTVRAPVTVQFSPTTYTVDEDDGSVDITVTLSESLSSDAQVTVVPGSRSSLSSSSVTILANSTTGATSLTIRDDLTLERDETVELRLSTSEARLSVADARATVTIVDDDEITLGFDQTLYTQLEGRDITICLHVISPRVAYPHDGGFTVHLSYDDLHGAGLSGPTAAEFNRGGIIRLCGTYDIPNDNVVEYTHTVEFTLDSVTSDLPGVASRVKFDSRSRTSRVDVLDNDRAFVELEHASYSVTEGDAAEVCAVLGRGATVAFPFTVNLSYTDPDGVVSSGPSSLTFQYLASKSCGSFQTHDDDVAGGNSEVSVSLARPTDLDHRINVSTRTAPLTVIDDESPNTVSVTVTSNWLGRTVTVDGTDRTTPYSATWNSGSSHTLDAPSPQTVSGGRYVFSGWSHGGPKSQTVSPTSHTTYTAGFTYQPDPTGHRPVAVGVSPLPPFPQDVSLISGFTQTFVARASDQDDNITEWEWFVDDVSRSRLTFAPTGIVTGQVNIQFIKPGSHTVKATFTDSTGLSDSISWDVEVKGPDLTTCAAPSGSSQRGCDSRTEACVATKP